jgi:hypothetical protein
MSTDAASDFCNRKSTKLEETLKAVSQVRRHAGRARGASPRVQARCLGAWAQPSAARDRSAPGGHAAGEQSPSRPGPLPRSLAPPRAQGLSEKRRALAQIEEVLTAKVMASRQQQAKQQQQQPRGAK